MEGMPPHLKALEQRVLGNKGLHIKLPYPRKFKPPGPNTIRASHLPTPLYYGLTMRLFFYAPAISKTETKFDIFRQGDIYQYYAQMWVQGDVVGYSYSGKGWNNEGNVRTEKRIPIPGYYSMAVRFKTGNYFAILYEDEEITAVFQGNDQNNMTWDFRIWPTEHYLMSLHLSNEYVNERHFPPQNLEQLYFLSLPVLGPGSRWTMRCIITALNDETEVIIVTHFSRQDNRPEGVGRPTFNSKSLKVGDQITVYITNSSTFYVVTTDFDPSVKRVDHGPYPWGNFMYPGVGLNCEIVKQYVEQVGITYSDS